MWQPFALNGNMPTITGDLNYITSSINPCCCRQQWHNVHWFGSGPQPCNVDVHLVISEDEGSVTLIYNSSRPNVTLFCGVDGMRARLCEDMHALVV